MILLAFFLMLLSLVIGAIGGNYILMLDPTIESMKTGYRLLCVSHALAGLAIGIVLGDTIKV